MYQISNFPDKCEACLLIVCIVNNALDSSFFYFAIINIIDILVKVVKEVETSGVVYCVRNILRAKPSTQIHYGLSKCSQLSAMMCDVKSLKVRCLYPVA